MQGSHVFILCFFLFSACICRSQTTGEIDGCSGCKPKVDTTIDNSLTINTQENTIAVVKIIENSANKCIRYIFVNKNETFEVKNIPKGTYTVKFVLGTDWDFSKKNKCKLHFKDKKPLIMKLAKSLQFKKIKKSDGYETSSFTINLGINFSELNVANQKLEDEF
ncbi:MAG: hypothetical protein HY958_01395 [Bacteroidia bacterium]|nr:hypothetical protein [Bacteroidia bacterium]